jgi:hypothetical protein
MKKFSIIALLFLVITGRATSLLIPMDETQTNHLRAYGIAFSVLTKGGKSQWLLNYRGGSFLLKYDKECELDCMEKGVTFETLPDSKVKAIMDEINKTENNMSVVNMERAPKIAVHTAPGVELWDDPVTLVLRYAGIPFDTIYDEQVLTGALTKYDWLHIHHEDFTGQYGKFFYAFSTSKWYMDEVSANERTAHQFGFQKVSQLKLAVAKQIRNFVSNGGFLFAMCSATDSYDIALAAEGTDICGNMYDGDQADLDMNSKLNYDACFAFQNFLVKTNPTEYEFSNIDTYETRTMKGINETNDYFTLEDYSVLTQKELCMLTQNHARRIKGFWGQTTGFDMSYIKPGVSVMGSTKSVNVKGTVKLVNEARYLHGNYEKGMWTYYGGHDPEDYQHRMGEPATDISKYPNSPGYRLILNNVLLPSTRSETTSTAVFSAYPNPATDFLNISYTVSGENPSMLLTIYDVTGKEQTKQMISSENSLVTIDISTLAAGSYFWRIENGSTIIATDKFSVVK